MGQVSETPAHGSKHKTRVLHFFNVGPTSSTLAQHCTNATQVLCARWVLSGPVSTASAQQTRHSQYVHIVYNAPMPFKCWLASYTMARYRINARYADTLPGQ